MFISLILLTHSYTNPLFLSLSVSFPHFIFTHLTFLALYPAFLHLSISFSLSSLPHLLLSQPSLLTLIFTHLILIYSLTYLLTLTLFLPSSPPTHLPPTQRPSPPSVLSFTLLPTFPLSLPLFNLLDFTSVTSSHPTPSHPSYHTATCSVYLHSPLYAHSPPLLLFIPLHTSLFYH